VSDVDLWSQNEGCSPGLLPHPMAATNPIAAATHYYMYAVMLSLQLLAMRRTM
jgi:hypothetical protein